MQSAKQDCLFDVSDRIIVVTGAAGQLGSAFSRSLAGAGARVVALDLNAAPELDGCFVVEADVTNRASLEQALVEIQRELGTPHGLVNAAAIDAPPDAAAEENGPFESYPEASWDRIMAVNAKGVFLCCQVFGGPMAAQGRGSIINIASIYGMLSPDQQLYQYRRDRGEVFFKPVTYSASKSAIYNLTRYLAGYWGAKNVRVNTVSFGGVFANQDEEFLVRYNAKVPLGRMANVEEYNGIIHFLLSDAASYITGSNLVADGGFSAL